MRQSHRHHATLWYTNTAVFSHTCFWEANSISGSSVMTACLPYLKRRGVSKVEILLGCNSVIALAAGVCLSGGTWHSAVTVAQVRQADLLQAGRQGLGEGEGADGGVTESLERTHSDTPTMACQKSILCQPINTSHPRPLQHTANWLFSHHDQAHCEAVSFSV